VCLKLGRTPLSKKNYGMGFLVNASFWSALTLNQRAWSLAECPIVTYADDGERSALSLSLVSVLSVMSAMIS